MNEAERQPSLTSCIEPWGNLWRHAVKNAQVAGHSTAARVKNEITQAALAFKGGKKILQGLSDEAKKLAWDCLSYLFDGCAEHQKRLKLSARKFEQGKEHLIQASLVREVWIGQTLFIVPTDALYEAFSMAPPRLRRRLSFDHSFAVRLGAHLVGQDPLVQWVQDEVPIGDSGATVDFVAGLRNGNREAYDVTLSISNVGANAAKCQDKGFSKIVFLCRDTKVKDAAWAGLRQSGLPPELLARCRCVLFSTLLKKQKALRMT